ncbi:MAG: phosphoribosylglycinamide formyltransferase [Pseudomonadota bacterium]
MLNLGILASGNGTNAENIIHFAQERPYQFNVACLVSDKPEAYCLERARRNQVPGFTVPYELNVEKNVAESKKNHEDKILEIFKNNNVHWVCLAGYMRLLSSHFLSQFYDSQLNHYRVINIHPSLLPQFPGKNAYGQAFSAGVSQAGVTVHWVDEGMDCGPVIIQKTFPRFPQDSLEDFTQRGFLLEHQIYREALQKIHGLTLEQSYAL